MVSAVVLAASPPARAQDVRWIAPPGCAGDHALRTGIETLLGRPLAPADRIAVHAEVRQEGADRWVVELRSIEDGTVERTLAADGCDALLDATALVLAWRIDPEVALEEPTPAPSPRVAYDPASRLGAPDAPLAMPGGTVVSLGVGAAFVLDVGTLPAIAPGVIGEVVVRIDRLDLRVRGGWLSTQGARLVNDSVGAPPGVGVDVEWAGGSLAACGRPLDGDADRPGFAICGGVQVGALIARGVGVSDPGRAEAAMGALSLGAVMPWAPIDALDLEVGLELSVAMGAPGFEVAPFGVVWEPSPVAGRLTIGGHVDVR
ncbi:hypothetical protein DB32_008711 [Sandaracinus amylolyticus]|uniref:Uncharacterized protein n=1 Tax=Sandaracinus amylolyticus TaxID=927083 RepID=A0A0F6WAG3_9BACT|nr:hypothetical protein DB32_008711 [Sandaracinus amylolyticus]